MSCVTDGRKTQNGPPPSPQNPIARIGRPNSHTESLHMASADRSHTLSPCQLRRRRACTNLDRHSNYILASYMSSATWPAPRLPGSNPRRRLVLPN